MARVELNQAAFREIAQSPEAHAVLAQKALQIKSRAESTAPRDTGDYAKSFEIVSGRPEQGTPVVRVASRDRAAAHIEWCTKHSPFGPTPPHNTLGNALESVVE